MNCKGKKPAIFLALLLALMFVLGAFFPSLSKDSDKCEHDWSFFKTLTNVSCDTDGIMLVYCSRCSNFEQRVIPALGHSLVEGSAATYPTCTTSGVTASSVCSTCNKIVKYPEPILALGHNPVVVPGKPATCSEPGFTDGEKCSRCNIVLVAQKMTFTDHIDENSDYFCDVCGISTKCLHKDVDLTGLSNPLGTCYSCGVNFLDCSTTSVSVGDVALGWYRAKPYSVFNLSYSSVSGENLEFLDLSNAYVSINSILEWMYMGELQGFNGCSSEWTVLSAEWDFSSYSYLYADDWVYFYVPESITFSPLTLENSSMQTKYVEATFSNFTIISGDGIEKIDW